MSTTTIATRHLVGMMKDLVRTAHTEPLFPHLCAVLLHTDRAEVEVESRDGDGPPLIETVPSSVLVGTSTDTSAIAQAHAPCEGSLHRTVLISVTDAKAIDKVFSELMKLVSKNTTHMTEIELMGNTLRVSEDEDVVPNGVELSLQVLEDQIEDFPSTIAWAMNPDTHSDVLDDKKKAVMPSYGTGLHAEHLLTIGAIAKRRAMPVAWYRHHQSRGVVVTIGSQYRAVIRPFPLGTENGEASEPLVAVFQPPLDRKKSGSRDQDVLAGV